MKKKWNRLCSFLLTAAMLVNMLPLSVFAQESKNSTSSTATIPMDTTTSVAATSQPKIVEENVEERTEYSKEFLLDNGLYIAAVYADPIHYEKNGEWEEINNTLKANTDGTFSNTAGVWDVSFPTQISGKKAVSITKDGYTLSFTMAGELQKSGNLQAEMMTAVASDTMSVAIGDKSETFAVNSALTAEGQIQAIDLSQEKAEAEHKEFILEKNTARLYYSDVYANTDMQYDLKGNQIKESIIMESYSSTLRGYRYTLNTDGMIPVLDDEGNITFFDENGKDIILYMPAPFLVDSAEEYNYDIQVSLTGSGSSYTLVYLLPDTWLSSADRSWPVILDPQVTAAPSTVNIRDHTVASNGSYSFTRKVLECGYGTSSHKQRIFLKYWKLPVLSSSDVIVSAYITLYKPNSSTKEHAMEVHKVNGTWHSETLTWDNQPTFNETVEDFVSVKAAGSYTWNVTDIVRGWYESSNTGMMFKLPNGDEDGPDATWKQFCSSDNSTNKPSLTIIYRNNNGLESYWDYTSSSAGRAGTGSVNSYTGNMIWTRGDIGFGGNRMPVSISHVYNLNDAANNDFGMGYGWRTNFNQRVYQWTENTNYYIWEDSDGTSHYFYKSASYTFLDEDGLELTLKTNGSGTKKYSITDKNGNVSYFDTNGRLSSMVNNQATASSIAITYTTTSGLLISTITDGAGRVYTFSYDDAGLLNRIDYQLDSDTSKSVANVRFEYTDGNLTSVTDNDGNKSLYSYANENTQFAPYPELGTDTETSNDSAVDISHLLISAQDIDGYTLTYTYYEPLYSFQPFRVQKVSESSGNALGGELTFKYAHNQTTFEDVNGNVQIMQFNNLGNTVSVQDNEGRAQYTKYAINDAADSGKANQLSLSSKLQNTVVNLLTNTSFEGSTVWHPFGAYATENTLSSTESYLGNKSLCIGPSNSAISETISIPSGATYTFSAYVKTEGHSASLKLGTASSETLAANQDWTRVEVSYKNTGDTALDIAAQVQVQAEGTGNVYVDCVQLEAFPTASRYNLVDSGDCSTIGNWTTDSQLVDAGSAAAPQLDNMAYQITGDMTTKKRVSQTIPVSGGEGDTFVLSGWAKGDSVPLPEAEDGDNQRQFAVIGTFHYTDDTTSKEFIAQFNPDTDSEVSWQYVAEVMVAEKAYDSITVELAYDYNANTVFFDGIQLFKENFGSSYAYDDEGNVTSVVDLQKKQTSYEYDENNNLTSIIEDNKAKMTYTYDDYHNVIKAESGEGLVYEFTYDTYGNNTAVSISGGDNAAVITSSATYSADGNRLVSTTDAAGNVTVYHYDADTNVLEWVKYPNDNEDTKTIYTYDNMFRMTKAEVTTDTHASLSASYTYENDLLTQIETGSTKYAFAYGNFGLRSSVKAGDYTLASYTYTTDRNNYLNSLVYGNGDSVQYEYDDHGRVTEQTYEDGIAVTYTYDNSGALATVTESATDTGTGTGTTTTTTTTYYYDFLDRVMKYVESSDSNTHSVGYEYDTINNLTSIVETINGTEHTTSYTYDDDNRVTAVSNGAVTKEYTYDAYGRTGTLTTKNGESPVKTDAFEFREADRTGSDTCVCECGCEYCSVPGSVAAVEGTYTTGQIENHIITAGSSTTKYTYTYDDNGNITAIKKDDVAVVSYVYDSANQLIRENNQVGDFTRTWDYDDAGNILYRKTYDYTTDRVLGEPTDTVAYTYGNSEWGDLLTGYDGIEFEYEATDNDNTIGNLANDGTWEYTWKHGRQLASMRNNNGTDDNSDDVTWTYTYNVDGLRTKRSNGTTTYEYIYNGSQLSQMTVGTNTLYFAYDVSGVPMTVTYDSDNTDTTEGVTYYYVTNIQGDVIGILDAGGNQVASYIYDAWGNILSTDGTMKDTLGALNPLRYRGYAYDTETGFYYVSSRYYDPEIGRWINADTTDVLSLPYYHPGQYNLFSYCNNNPINDRDDDGQLSWLAKIAIGAAAIAVGVGVTALTGGAALPALVAGVKAACVAGAISAGTSAAKTAVRSVASGDSFSTVVQKSAKSAVDGFADGFMAGGIAAGASQVASGGFKIAAKLGAKTGKSGGIKLGNTKILSPDAVWQKNNGGTLLKIGKTFRIDVGSNTLLHMHIPKVSSHIQIGTIGAGIYGGLK